MVWLEHLPQMREILGSIRSATGRSPGFFFFLFFFLPGIEAPSPGIRFWAICLKKVASSFHSLLVPFPCERFGWGVLLDEREFG